MKIRKGLAWMGAALAVCAIALSLGVGTSAPAEAAPSGMESVTQLVFGEYNVGFPFSLSDGQHIALQLDATGRLLTAPNPGPTGQHGANAVEGVVNGYPLNTQGTNTFPTNSGVGSSTALNLDVNAFLSCEWQPGTISLTSQNYYPVACDPNYSLQVTSGGSTTTEIVAATNDSSCTALVANPTTLHKIFSATSGETASISIYTATGCAAAKLLYTITPTTNPITLDTAVNGIWVKTSAATVVNDYITSS